MQKRINTPANDKAVEALVSGRSKLGMTQKELSCVTGVKKQHIVDCERYRIRVTAGLLLQVEALLQSRDKAEKGKKPIKRAEAEA